MMFEGLKRFFRLGSTGVRARELPPVDLDLPNESLIVTSSSRLTPQQFEKFKAAFMAPLPNTTHKPPRKRTGKAKRAGKSKRRAA